MLRAAALRQLECLDQDKRSRTIVPAEAPGHLSKNDRRAMFESRTDGSRMVLHVCLLFRHVIQLQWEAVESPSAPPLTRLIVGQHLPLRLLDSNYKQPYSVVWRMPSRRTADCTSNVL